MDTHSQKKTISYLRSKAWYRLLKVFFFLGLLGVLVFFNTIAFSNGVIQFNNDKTLVQCNLKDKKLFTTSSVGLDLNGDYFPDRQFNYRDFFEGINIPYENSEINVDIILSNCYPGWDKSSIVSDSYDFQKFFETANENGLINNTPTQEQVDTAKTQYDSYTASTTNLVGNQKASYLDFSFEVFTIKPVFSYSPFIEIFLIGNIIILFVFEALRRIFYYIVLGKIKPEK